MDWVKYYQDQINMSYNNKVEDFTGNQTGGFPFLARPLSTFLWKQKYALRKWIHPESIKRIKRSIKRKKLIEHKKKMEEINGRAQEPIQPF